MIAQSTILFQEYLVEILLSVILMFNIGMYRTLKADVDENTKFRRKIRPLLLGHNEIDNGEGYIEEVEDINKTLKDIREHIEEESERREEEFSLLERQLEHLIDTLSDEENIDFDESDIVANRKIFKR